MTLNSQEVRLNTGKLEKTQKTGILRLYDFSKFSEFSNVGSISPQVKLLSVFYARREVMSHQCDYSLLDTEYK